MILREDASFEVWQWQEEVTVFTLEEVGLGINQEFYKIFLNMVFPALIINLVGLGISTIVFIIEIIFHKANKR